MEKCPKCNNTNVKKCLIKSEKNRPDPFAEFMYECQHCMYFWFDKNESGKGTF